MRKQRKKTGKLLHGHVDDTTDRAREATGGGGGGGGERAPRRNEPPPSRVSGDRTKLTCSCSCVRPRSHVSIFFLSPTAYGPVVVAIAVGIRPVDGGTTARRSAVRSHPTRRKTVDVFTRARHLGHGDRGPVVCGTRRPSVASAIQLLRRQRDGVGAGGFLLICPGQQKRRRHRSHVNYRARRRPRTTMFLLFRFHSNVCLVLTLFFFITFAYVQRHLPACTRIFDGGPDDEPASRHMPPGISFRLLKNNVRSEPHV